MNGSLNLDDLKHHCFKNEYEPVYLLEVYTKFVHLP